MEKTIWAKNLYCNADILTTGVEYFVITSKIYLGSGGLDKG